MKTIIYTLGAAALAVIPVHGRIGETREQCAARYGELLVERKRSTTHQVGSIEVNCIYDSEGKCEEIQYEVSARLVTREGKENLNETQSFNLLAVNSASRWVKAEHSNLGEPWEGTYRTEDGSVEASLVFGRVYIQTMKAIQRETALLGKEKIAASVNSLTAGAKVDAVQRSSNPVAILRRILSERSTIASANRSTVRSEMAEHTQGNADAVAKVREDLAKQDDPAVKILLEVYDMGLEIEQKEIAAARASGEEKTAIGWELINLKSKQMGLAIKATDFSK